MTDYNIEDTAKLMTQARSGGRRKKMILIAAAVIAVILIAVLSIKLVGDKKYNDQIAIAETALAEGNYEQAEAEYLRAVDMKGRKPKAREGLAYTYALEEKYEESRQTYQELYDQTQDEQYQRAAADVSNGILPAIDGIFPSETIWVSISQDRLTEADDLLWFMEQYLSMYSFYAYMDENNRGTRIEDFVYDSEAPGNSYALPMAHNLIDERNYPEYLEEYEWYTEGSDPRGWQDGYIQRIRKDVLDEVFSDLFNATDDGIAEAAASAEDAGMMYPEGEYYYQFDPLTDYGSIEAEPVRVQINGSRCCIEYRAIVVPYDAPDTVSGTDIGTFYAVMKLKEINGGMHWTMISNGPEKPDYVGQPQKPVEDGESENMAAVNKAYAEVLRENEDGIKAYWWQYGTDMEDGPLNGYDFSSGDGTRIVDDPLNKCVSIEDIDGDGVPELMFFASENPSLGCLYMYTYKGGKAVQLTCEADISLLPDFTSTNPDGTVLFSDAAVAAGTYYMVYTGKTPGTFYIAYSIGDDFNSWFSMEYHFDGEKLSMDHYVQNYYYHGYEPENEPEVDEYYIDGSLVSSGEGTEEFRKAADDYSSLIMFSGNVTELAVFEHIFTDTPLAMTYNEALSSLDN